VNRRSARASLLAALVVSAACLACGKKGPPLPPLVLLPAAPADVAAVRRGDHVDLEFRIPAANADRSTPADVARVEVFALTGPAPADAAEVVRAGTRVGTIAVNKPKDPEAPEPKTPAPKGPGLDQGELATFNEVVPPGAEPSSYRTYVTLGFNSRGRRGVPSPALAVPLVAPPPAPAAPQVTYDETSITVTWPAVAVADGTPVAYALYRPGTPVVALTPTPVAEPSFADRAIVWAEERCYEVRAVTTVDRVRVESAASPSACVTLRDTFAPPQPEGLVGVGSDGAVSLIWTASTASDLAGYLVLRAVAPATELVPVTPAPIPDTNFRDTVPSGGRVTYAVQAVDKAGNRSRPSASIAETAR